MIEDAEIGFFQSSTGLETTQRCLPHWFQPNVAVFLTFRTADSLPSAVLLRWRSEQVDWLKQEGWKIDPDDALPDFDQLPASLRQKFNRHRDRRWHWQLDTCHGECLLRRREYAKIVLDTLIHFDKDRYDLDCLIIMPNHVHVLVQFRPPTTCRAQSESWLRFSARLLNKQLSRQGAFWQSEPFDHLVRSPEQFDYLRWYIAENGRKANLPEADYLFWNS